MLRIGRRIVDHICCALWPWRAISRRVDVDCWMTDPLNRQPYVGRTYHASLWGRLFGVIGDAKTDKGMN